MIAASALHYNQQTRRFVLNGTEVCGWCLEPCERRYCDDEHRHQAALERRRLRYRLAALGPITETRPPALVDAPDFELDLTTAGGAR